MTFKVLFYILKLVFCGVFNVGNKQLKIAGKELISKRTFRLPDNASHDKVIGFRQFKRSWQAIKRGKPIENEVSSILAFESAIKSVPQRIQFLIWSKNYQENSILGISRPELCVFNSVFPIRFGLILLSLIVMPISVISSNRVQWAILLSEFVEIVGLMNFMKQCNVRTVHFFNVAEKDSNALYLLLKTFDCEVIKHPSPGALIAHNKNLMTDVLALSSKYQKEEYELLLKETIYAGKIEMWSPENAIEYDELYLNKEKPQTFTYKVGFYSHGGWVRKQTKATKGLFAKPEEELKALSVLSEFMKSNREEKLVIYLHPKEKSQFEKAKEFYENYFELSKVDFYIGDLSSSSFFNEAEFGIGAYSTVLFERDNYGFKTIVWRENKNFPLEGTSMHKSSFSNLEELNCLILN